MYTVVVTLDQHHSPLGGTTAMWLMVQIRNVDGCGCHDVQSGSVFAMPFYRPCVGPLRSETNFLRRTPSTWRTGTNTSISPGSRQPYWRSSCHSFRRALARAIWCDVALTESKRTGVSSRQMGGCPPSAGPTRFPPVPAPWLAVRVRS